MQVNLSANLSNPAGETNAKSAEVAEAGAANGFFAQMGQILNQGNEIIKPEADPGAFDASFQFSRKTCATLVAGHLFAIAPGSDCGTGACESLKVPALCPNSFSGSDDAGTEAQDAGAAQAMPRSPAAWLLARERNRFRVSTSNAEKGIADLHPSASVSR